VKILITGAAGLIGSHAAQRLAREHEVVALKRADLDIADRESVSRCVSDAKPALIINGAVIQVDESEQNPAKAHAVNVEGPRNLAEAASRAGAEFIHFSTQYAFDGEPIESPEDLLDRLIGDRVGRQVAVRVVRGGATMEIPVTVGERPN